MSIKSPEKWSINLALWKIFISVSRTFGVGNFAEHLLPFSNLANYEGDIRNFTSGNWRKFFQHSQNLRWRQFRRAWRIILSIDFPLQQQIASTIESNRKWILLGARCVYAVNQKRIMKHMHNWTMENVFDVLNNCDRFAIENWRERWQLGTFSRSPSQTYNLRPQFFLYLECLPSKIEIQLN